jgi:PAS domain S-box-containing protein
LIRAKEQYESMYSMMRHLCDTVPDMLWAQDLEGKFIFVNQKAASVLLKTDDTNEPVGKTINDYPVFSPVVQYQNQICEPPVRDKDCPDTTSARQAIIQSDNKEIELEVRSAPFYTTSGELIGTVAAGRDVTEAREAHRIIQKERKRYSSIFESVHIGLISCSPEGIITDMNRRAMDLLGLDTENTKGLNLYTLHGLGKNEFIKDFTSAIVQKRTIRGKGSFSHKDSGARILYYSISPQIGDESDIQGLILSFDEHYLD